jgi:hypothetical protein
MAKKQAIKSQKHAEPALTAEEAAELQLILDRFAVQSPEGESFKNWLQVLGGSLEGREQLAAALLLALSRHPSEAGFRAFGVLKDRVSGRRWAKIVKQAGYRFSQRGYHGDAATVKTEPVVLVAQEVRASQAHMAVGSAGYVFLSALIAPSPGSDPVSVVAYFENDLSRMALKCTATSTRHYREFNQKMSQLFAFPLHEIPIWHAAKLYGEMEEWAGGGPATTDARLARQLLGDFLEPHRRPYVHELMEPVESVDNGMMDLELEPLFAFIPVNYLVPGREEVSELAQRIRDLESSVLVIPHEMKMERVEAIIGSTMERLFAGERRHRVKRLFEELALWLLLSRQPYLARDAWVVAQHLQSSASVMKNRVLSQLVYQSLQNHWPEDFEPREEPKISGHGYQETESGLILLK